MRVLYITSPSFFDLDVSLIRELAKNIEVEVLFLVSPISMNGSAFSIKELPINVSICRFSEISELSKYSKILDTNRWNIASVPVYNYINCIKLGRKVKEFLKGKEYDIVHSTGVGKQSMFIIPAISRYKRLLTMHDPITHGRESKIAFYRRLLFVSFYKNILLLSHSLEAEFLAKFKIASPQLYFSRLGIYDYFCSIDALNPKIKDYILFFGRIEEYKGVDVLIEAFNKSKSKKQGIKLVIAGKGELPANFNPNDNQVIAYNRFIENEELSGLIKSSICTVLPYKSATQSGCVMTSFAFNKPVIATNVGDLPNEVCHKKTGYIVDANDSSALSKAIDLVAIENFSSLSENIKSMYYNNGEKSWVSIANNLIKVYNDIL